MTGRMSRNGTGGGSTRDRDAWWRTRRDLKLLSKNNSDGGEAAGVPHARLNNTYCIHKSTQTFIMFTLKAFFIVTIIVCIRNVHALRTAAFPIGMWKLLYFRNKISATKTFGLCLFSGGLFNRETLATSKQVFENMIEANQMMTYHGRSLDSKVVDSYSTSLERKSTSSYTKAGPKYWSYGIRSVLGGCIIWSYWLQNTFTFIFFPKNIVIRFLVRVFSMIVIGNIQICESYFTFYKLCIFNAIFVSYFVVSPD